MTDVPDSARGRGSRPRGYAPWRPQTETRVLIGQIEAILDEYSDHLPLTVRQIFYRLVGNFGYEKTELAYKRLAEHLVRARRAKLISFDVIRDDGVDVYEAEWFSSPDGFWEETDRRISRYRRDRQAGQSSRLEVWCEAAGMAPQLFRVASVYGVPVFTTGGFGSLTAVWDIAERAVDREVPTVLLHVGDLDPSGESIFEAIAQDAAAFVEADRTDSTTGIVARRIALTRDQVDRFGLPTAPAKPTDSRTKGWQGETCQLEALAPDQLAALVREAIEAELDLGVYRVEVDLEDEDRAELRGALPESDE